MILKTLRSEWKRKLLCPVRKKKKRWCSSTVKEATTCLKRNEHCWLKKKKKRWCGSSGKVNHGKCRFSSSVMSQQYSNIAEQHYNVCWERHSPMCIIMFQECYSTMSSTFSPLSQLLVRSVRSPCLSASDDQHTLLTSSADTSLLSGVRSDADHMLVLNKGTLPKCVLDH